MSESLTTAGGVPFLRTPDAAFAGLPDYAFQPRYFEVDGLRMHYVDEGPRDGPAAVLTHGMPTWSFLNRKIIGRLAAEGWRCVAADHLGFGRSDKPIDDDWYSIAKHSAAHRALVEHLGLSDITLFVQDWGGPIGLSHAAEDPDRFARLVIMNTWLHHADYDYTPALRQWNSQWQDGGLFRTNIPEPLSMGWFMMLPLGHMQPANLFGIIQGEGIPDLAEGVDGVRRGYDAPFEGLGRAGLAGPRRFPLSLPFDNPTGGNAEAQARHFEALLGWKKPIHFIWGGSDGVFTEDWGRAWASRCRQASFDIFPEAGHFLQDTHGDRIAEVFLSRIG